MIFSQKIRRKTRLFALKAQRSGGTALLEGLFDASDEAGFFFAVAVLALCLLGWLLVLIVRSILDGTSGGSGLQGLGLS